jgi:hypothetical protein
MSGIDLIPEPVHSLYEIHEWRNAVAVLAGAHPQEWAEILTILGAFRFRRSQVMQGGGNETSIARGLKTQFQNHGWRAKQFDITITIEEYEYATGRRKNAKVKTGEQEHKTPTHEVDYFKNGVALELEWNNKDPFFDRDLNNFRLLFDLRAIDAGVIITRRSELQLIFNRLGIGKKYGESTTHMRQLLPRIEGGGGGGCPILVFGISEHLYVEDQ